jgi:hypothetical protein
MKRCFKCGEELPLDAFYKHPATADRHLAKCKSCTKLDMWNDRRDKPRVREYDRARASQPHRAALRRRIADKWEHDHPEWKKAQTAAGNAVRDGRLKRETRCQRCGIENGRIEKHHPDYSEPLKVEWLCKPCHAIADQERREAEQ